MKQLVQNNQTGAIELADVPQPIPKSREILVRTLASAVSSGTERGNLDFAKANLLAKARRRPDLVGKVLNKARQEGVLQAYREARTRLDLPFPLGYSSAGVVIDSGTGAGTFPPGTLVACSGAHFATHGEFVTLPESMATKIPDGVDADEAAFAALGAIVIHGMRIGETELGGNIAIVGLGLLGLLGVQIAKAGGMRVAALDISQDRVDLARELGADIAVPVGESAAETVCAWAGETAGADVVLIAATSQDNAPLVLAAELARERGTLVLLGNFPPDLPRRYGYDKELSLRFTRAWGPGTYDPAYQERGHEDGYPPSLVRWSARRNMAAYLDLVASGTVSVRPLLSRNYSIDESVSAYDALGDSSVLGLVITYPASDPSKTVLDNDLDDSKVAAEPGAEPDKAVDSRQASRPRSGGARVGLIGAGQYATGQLLPTLAKIDGVQLEGLTSASGLKSWFATRKYGFRYAAADPAEVIGDPEIDGIIIATRHNLHAELASAALLSGKDVWVEKPLALSFDELDLVEAALEQSSRSLVVGFNRRYSPLSARARDALSKSGGPLQISMVVNPGPLDKGHWVLDPGEGGGRLLSEGCHFFDLACYLTRANPVAVSALPAGESEPHRQGFVATVEFTDGSIAQITYAGSGPRSLSREQIVAIGSGVSAAIDNFKTLTTSTGLRTRRSHNISLKKGFSQLAQDFVAQMQSGGTRSGDMNPFLLSSALTLSAAESLRRGVRITLDTRARPAD